MNWPDSYRSDEPTYHDPRYQRLVVAMRRPIAIVENVVELKLACGHEPLVMGDQIPAVGSKCFCPDCYEARNDNRN